MAIAAATIGVLSSTQESVLRMEESLGLGILYGMRGPVDAPSQIIIVGIDSASAERLGLAEELGDNPGLTGWPRELHAELIAALDEAGVGLIVFDIFMIEPQTVSADAALAAAMANSGSVVLAERMDRDAPAIRTTSEGRRFQIVGAGTTPPLPMLRGAARGTAPFHLPTVPFRVNQYWTFLDNLHERPTLPVLAFGLYSRRALEVLADSVSEARPAMMPDWRALNEADLMASLRRALLLDGELAGEVQARLERAHRSNADVAAAAIATRLLELHAGRDSAYINFYGTPHTITTVPVHELLIDGPRTDLQWQDAAVFVGFSDALQPKQDDFFPSVFSQLSGVNLSGVEIAATAFANLADGRTLRPVPMSLHLAMLAALGLIFGAVFAARSVRSALAALFTCASLYFLTSLLLFVLASIWLPVVVPVLIQMPVALVLGLVVHYAAARRQQRAVAQAAAQYLPAELVTQFGRVMGPFKPQSEIVQGVCLATDIEGYTSYSESVTGDELKASLNAYYDELFSIVDANDGIVTDIVGDSMVAVWRAGFDEPGARLSPIAAALEIQERLVTLGSALPRTRAGIAGGDFLLGSIGAKGHMEYRAIGDTINSAARIQELNKRLGTQVLASESIVPRGSVLYRPLGAFQLRGKSTVLEICEPLALHANARSAQRELCERFACALESFRQRRWPEARKHFDTICTDFAGDGPSSFYIDLIDREGAGQSLDEFDGVIRLG